MPDQSIAAPQRATKSLYLIVFLLVAGAIAASFTMRGNGRLDRARAAASEYGLLDAPPLSRAPDLLPWSRSAGDWSRRHKVDDSSSVSLAGLPVVAVNELLVLGNQVTALSTSLGPGTVELLHKVEDPVRLIDALLVGQAFVSATKGTAPSLSMDQRFDALIAVLHLAKALTQRSFAGLMVGTVLTQEARSGYDTALADGLTMNPGQRVRLLAILEDLDLGDAAVQAHSATVAMAFKDDAEDLSWQPKAGGLRGLISRLRGRSSDDEALALELAVLTHRSWIEDGPDAGQEHSAITKGLSFDRLPLAEHLGSMLHQRMQIVRVSTGLLVAWEVEVRFEK